MLDLLEHPAVHPGVLEDGTRRDFIIGGLSIAALLSGCSTDVEQQVPTAPEPARLVKDGRGQDVGLDHRPEKVVTISAESLDVNTLLDVGLAPQSYGGPTRDQPWATDALAASEQMATAGAVNLERIAALGPELIVCSQQDEKL